MMELLQWCINVAFLAYLVWSWWSKEEVQVTVPAEVQQAISQLENKILEWEKDHKRSQEIYLEKMKSIDAVCEQANRILRSNRSPQMSFPPSQEEHELKEALSQSLIPQEIPTLGFLERTKKRLQRESELDLKTLLKTQLS